jgi:archaellum biogenesis protein FlaJ (TadC family)
MRHVFGAIIVCLLLAMFYYADKTDKARAAEGIKTSDNTAMAVVALVAIAFWAIWYFLEIPR